MSKHYLNAHITHPSIHCFADASQHEYEAIVFLIQDNHASFVIAKTRVAPLKALTIELIAALVAMRLTYFFLDAILAYDPPTFMWSDSQIMLHWVRNQKPLPTLVRVIEMKSLLPNATWNFCPTDENPADLLSRGTTTKVLMSSSFWQHGPKWLPSPNKWPSSQLPPIPPLIVATTIATEFVLTVPPLLDSGLHYIIITDRYTILCKLLAVTAYVIRFADNLSTTSPLTTWANLCRGVCNDKVTMGQGTQQLVYNKEVNNLQQMARLPNTMIDACPTTLTLP